MRYIVVKHRYYLQLSCNFPVVGVNTMTVNRQKRQHMKGGLVSLAALSLPLGGWFVLRRERRFNREIVPCDRLELPQ